MSMQSKSMPKMDLKMYVRVVAAVFAISSVTATVLVLVRLVSPDLYYLHHLTDKDRYTHYFICSLMIAVGIIGFINSFVVMTRNAVHNVGKNITLWLLLGSLFETSRIVYVFISEVVMKSDGRMRLWELGVSVAQYLVDSFLYCQMILRH